MKKQILSLALIGLLALTSCTEKKQGEVPDEAIPATGEVDKTGTDAAVTDSLVKKDTVADIPKEGDVITITGKVTQINKGKDGYSARVYATSGQHYVATISIPNMANPKDYRPVKEGEEITVTGVAFPVEEDIMIKVTKLH